MIRGLAALLLLSCGCALTSRGAVLDVRWFTPDRYATPHACAPPAPGRSLRLGTVKAGAGLEERIRHSDGAYEIGYYDSVRWTDRPERFVSNALTKTLFEECGFQRILEGEAPTLDVDLLAFEEVRTPGAHNARVALRVVVSTNRVLLESTIEVVKPVTGDRFDDVVAALANALDEAAAQAAQRVGAALLHGGTALAPGTVPG